MVANHIHDALAQVRKLQELILEKKLFRGYSGVARMIGGLLAGTGASILTSTAVPSSPNAHLAGWGLVLAAALLINYGALAAWFFSNALARRELLKAIPIIDAVPALAVGAILSLAMILNARHEFLPGIWMCLYGLAHVSYRLSLPIANYGVGLFYILSGSICLIILPPFTNPWPMGLTFLTGELAGGFILYKNNTNTGASDANHS